MIKANFNAYANYETDSLYQWDRNQVLSVHGLNVATAPEIHFYNCTMDKSIVRQAELIDHVVTVPIPNSLLQSAHTIYATIGIYEGETFKTIETITIPVIPKARPSDYQLENDDEVYSFESLKNHIANMVKIKDFNAHKSTINARIDNIIAQTNKTDGNSELIDLRVSADGKIYNSAGTAVRNEMIILRMLNEGLIAPSFNLDEVLFERGSWNHNDVKSEGEKNRIRTVNAISFPYDTTLYIGDGFQVRGYWCDDAGMSTELFTWITNPIVIPANQKIKFVIARLIENPDEIANVSEYITNIIVKSHFKKQIDRLSFVMSNMKSQRFYLNPDDFRHGWIEGWNNGIFNDVPRYRIATPDIMSFPYDIIIRANSGYRFALNYWNNGEFASDELWQTEFFVPANQSFKMMISRSPEDSTETVSILEMISNVYIESGDLEIKRRVDLLREIVETPQPINKTVRNINHRGDNINYPENTLIAFKGSKNNGFNFVETDIRFTSDNIPVLLHDETINRTGRNNDGSQFDEEIYINNITYRDVSKYDFGRYKDQSFAGTKIPTFDEFIRLCRQLGLHPYIEIEGEITEDQAEILINIVTNSGLINYVTWISFSYESLLRILEKNPSARVGLNCITSNGFTEYQTNYISKIKALTNNVFVHVDMNSVDKCVEMAQIYGVPLEVWCPNTVEEIINLPDYVSGVTSDELLADEVIRENALA